MALPARSKYIILSVLFILASINFVRTGVEILENSKRLDDLSQEVNEMDLNKKDLEESVQYKKTEEYIEERARNDLSMIKPGEKVYVLSQPEAVTAKKIDVLSAESIRESNIEDDKLSNIEQWINLFIKR